MSVDMIIRAWKDSKYRASLTAEQRAMLPANPAGELMLMELSEEQLKGVVGASSNTNCQCVTAQGSCGVICTATKECPFLSICC